MNLLNPSTFRKSSKQLKNSPQIDILLNKTIQFFESRGKKQLKEDYNSAKWYSEFLDFVKEEKVFATLLTPSPYGDLQSRWDTSQICRMSEVLGFYGLNYWYTWQVSMLGLGPIWMSKNEELKGKAAKLLENGGIFAFGLSEKEHGADLYSSEMQLVQKKDGSYLANGTKYYIGNGNKASLVSTFGKISPGEDFVFFTVDSQHAKYKCIQNVVHSQNYVSEYALDKYPISEKEILSRGQDAWDASLNTINICKFNLGWASIGICTHAFYESITHASNRKLFDHFVTDFPHIQQLFVDAYSRLIAMKLFASRASDYMRSASIEDRRYLLYNPLVKMKVTTQGEEVIDHLWDIMAAKGFERSMYFDTAAKDVRALPKLEGTVHVNMALVIKFMKNFFFHPKKFSEVIKRDDFSQDDFLFNQGTTRGLGKIQFHDYKIAYDSCSLPNVKIFKKQIAGFKRLLFLASPSKEQTKDFDFLLILGELFSLVAYGQLIIENSKIRGVDDALLDQIFDFMIRDFSKFALKLYSKTSSTPIQMALCTGMVRKPTKNIERFNEVWTKHVYSMKEAYQMPE